MKPYYSTMQAAHDARRAAPVAIRSRWLNPTGYTDYPIPREGWWERWTARELVDFRLDPLRPLTAMHVRTPTPDKVTLVQPRRHFPSDMASTPRFLWMIPGYNRSCYKRAAYLHDSAYYNGDGAGHIAFVAVIDIKIVYEAEAGCHDHADDIILRAAQFERIDVTRDWADDDLQRNLILDDCPPHRAAVWHGFVTACGPRW